MNWFRDFNPIVLWNEISLPYKIILVVGLVAYVVLSLVLGTKPILP